MNHSTHALTPSPRASRPALAPTRRAPAVRTALAALFLVAPALVSAVLVSAVLPGGLAAQDAGVSLPTGTAAPKAQLEDLEGNPVQLSDYYQGKPTVIEFWASWCKDCEALMPQMKEIHSRWGGEVNVVAVAVGVGQSVRRVRRHLERDDPGYPHLWDGKGEAVRAFKAPTTSVVVILDAQGRVAYTGVGPDQDLVGAVEEVVGGAP